MLCRGNRVPARRVHDNNPRLVAAWISTLSTTYSARPITLSFLAAWNAAVTFVWLQPPAREFGNHFDEVRLGHIGLHNDFELSARGDLIQPALGDRISD